MAIVDANALKNRLGRLLALLAAAAGVGGLLLLSLSVENYEEFSSLQLWSLAGNAFAVLVLAYLLTRKVVQLVRDYRSHVPGSRLTARTVGIFGTLVAAPLIVVYLFSLEYLNRGIDSWFQSEIRTPIYEAVLLTRGALNVRQREQLRRTQALAHQLGFIHGHELLQLLDAARRDNGDSQVVVYDANNRALAASSEVITILPGVQPREVLLELTAGRDYVSLRTGEENRYLITAAAGNAGCAGGPLSGHHARGAGGTRRAGRSRAACLQSIRRAGQRPTAAEVQLPAGHDTGGAADTAGCHLRRHFLGATPDAAGAGSDRWHTRGGQGRLRHQGAPAIAR
jgi:hypothetical protein